MRVRAVTLRILPITTIALVSFVLLLFAFVQGEQHLLRHRATRLLADYKTLQLGQTSWPEVQSFAHRWQHWGYASQPCTEIYCTYNIMIGDTISMHAPLSDRGERWLEISHAIPFLNRLGYRAGGIDATVTVINGLLLSDHIGLSVVAHGNDLEMSASSRPNLALDQNHSDYQSQMADHPDYFVGRPGACEGCYIGWVHFVPHLGKEQLAHITDFQLDCFTKWKPCELTEDILPMAAPYHLYDQEARNAGWSRESPVCSLSPYTRGRDAYWVVVLDALSTESHKLGEYEEHEGYEYGEHVKVSWVSVLKGDLPPQVKATDTFMPFPGFRSDDFNEAPEHLMPGKRYIVFWSATALEGVASLDRCGFIPDTPENRASVVAGIAEDLRFESPKLDLKPE